MGILWLIPNLLYNTSPRGKQSIPIIDSSTEDLPADWEPSTHILGNENTSFKPWSLRSS